MSKDFQIYTLHYSEFWEPMIPLDGDSIIAVNYFNNEVIYEEGDSIKSYRYPSSSTDIKYNSFPERDANMNPIKVSYPKLRNQIINDKLRHITPLEAYYETIEGMKDLDIKLDMFYNLLILNSETLSYETFNRGFYTFVLDSNGTLLGYLNFVSRISTWDKKSPLAISSQYPLSLVNYLNEYEIKIIIDSILLCIMLTTGVNIIYLAKSQEEIHALETFGPTNFMLDTKGMDINFIWNVQTIIKREDSGRLFKHENFNKTKFYHNEDQFKNVDLTRYIRYELLL